MSPGSDSSIPSGGLRVESLRCFHLGPFSFQVTAGDCVGLVGPSGSGKSLLLRSVADLDRHEGRVLLDGNECATIPAPEWRRRVGLLPARSSWWKATVGDHFTDVDAIPLRPLGLAASLLDVRPAQLSSGESQRFALARLLERRPAVLLLDEPTAHLDPDTTRAVERVVAEYRHRERAPVLWVAHDEAQLRRVATRQLRIVDGALAAGLDEAGVAG